MTHTRIIDCADENTRTLSGCAGRRSRMMLLKREQGAVDTIGNHHHPTRLGCSGQGFIRSTRASKGAGADGRIPQRLGRLRMFGV